LNGRVIGLSAEFYISAFNCTRGLCRPTRSVQGLLRSTRCVCVTLDHSGDSMQANRTAIVTGSTSGIGLGIARTLAGSGLNVVLNGFGNAGEIDKLVDELTRQHNVGVMYSDANIANPDEIAAMFERAHAHFDGVDIIVNNAGVQHVAPIEEFPVTSGIRS